MDKSISKTIDTDSFISEFNRLYCPSHFGFGGKKSEICGLRNGHYDCETCWGIALLKIKEVELVYRLMDFKFKEGE